MNSIPRLVGDAIPVTSGTRNDKVFIVVNHPGDVENNRPIEQLSPSEFMKWMGYVIRETRVPTSSDFKDSSNNYYPVGAIWINSSTTPNTAYLLSNRQEDEHGVVSSATWIKLFKATSVLTPSENNWNNIPGMNETYFITTSASSVNSPVTTNGTWFVRIFTDEAQINKIMFATDMSNPATTCIRSCNSGIWTAWKFTYSQWA